MFFHDDRWPAPYNEALYTCDWGRSEVYLHNLPAEGATFLPNEKPFVKIPRPTDVDVDGSGRMYISSWKNGKFNYDGPNVGFVAQVTPIDFLAKPFPVLSELSDSELVEMLDSSSAKHRLHAQREILRRKSTDEVVSQLVEMAKNSQTSSAGMVAAIFTLKQMKGSDVQNQLLALADMALTRELRLAGVD